MKKKIFLAAVMMFIFVNGRNGEAIAQAAEAAEREGATQTDDAVFQVLPECFYFSSGAGAWGTELQIKEEGSFVGQYHDSEMGSTGEGYPNGTVYICNFEGKFSEVEKIDDCTYSMKLETIDAEGTVGESYCEDGIRYVYAEPYGIAGGEEFMLYLPGCRIVDLPEGFVVGSHVLWSDPDAEILDCYGIYNVNGEAAFVGYREDVYFFLS